MPTAFTFMIHTHPSTGLAPMRQAEPDPAFRHHLSRHLKDCDHKQDPCDAAV